MGTGDVRLLTVQAAALQLGVHPETLRKWVRQGKIKATKDRLRPGSPVLIEQADLIAFRMEMQGR